MLLNENGILRVGGRLQEHPNITFQTKHSMPIPKIHNITLCNIRYYNSFVLNMGLELVLNKTEVVHNTPIVCDYKGRSSVKKEIRDCIRCLHLCMLLRKF